MNKKALATEATANATSFKYFWTMSCYTLGWFFKSFLIWTDISCISNSIYMTNNLAEATRFLPVNHKINVVEKGRETVKWRQLSSISGFNQGDVRF